MKDVSFQIQPIQSISFRGNVVPGDSIHLKWSTLPSSSAIPTVDILFHKIGCCREYTETLIATVPNDGEFSFIVDQSFVQTMPTPYTYTIVIRGGTPETRAVHNTAPEIFFVRPCDIRAQTLSVN